VSWLACGAAERRVERLDEVVEVAFSDQPRSDQVMTPERADQSRTT
jgi:hypothetical protein